MSNKVMLITGTSKGIGKFLAEYYVKRDIKVIGCSRRGFTINHPNYLHYQCDVRIEKEIQKIVGNIVNKFRRIDILINNVGIDKMNHSILMPLDTARMIIETNFFSTFLMCREVAKIMMKNRWGRIVNVSSIAVPMLIEGESIYAASKSAIETFTKILAKELAPFNITCNNVGPSPVETELIKDVPKEKLQWLINQMPIKKFGTPAEVANIIDFFIREESRSITAQVIYLGGAN